MRPRPTYAASFALVLFVVGRLIALAHDAEARHVTCAEHGETLEAGEAETRTDSGAKQLVGVDHDGGAHDDCAAVRLLNASAIVATGATVAVLATPVAAERAVALEAEARVVEVIAIAPKTSPPQRT